MTILLRGTQVARDGPFVVSSGVCRASHPVLATILARGDVLPSGLFLSLQGFYRLIGGIRAPLAAGVAKNTGLGQLPDAEHLL
ncbi:MAG: hypothetical protein ONB06_06060, partial [candidate division KSB1 bacterium]|nr:hypothetical protein [candidate division KSB1 bacterium]